MLEASTKSMPTCVLRPSVLFGKGDTQLIPPIHACLAKQETPWVVGDGTNLWDVTYVGNVADAHVLAAENLMSSKTATGETFFIQNNEPISFRDFSLEIWKNFGHVCCRFSLLPGLLRHCFAHGAQPECLPTTMCYNGHTTNYPMRPALISTIAGTAICVPHP